MPLLFLLTHLTYETIEPGQPMPVWLAKAQTAPGFRAQPTKRRRPLSRVSRENGLARKPSVGPPPSRRSRSASP